MGNGSPARSQGSSRTPSPGLSKRGLPAKELDARYEITTQKLGEGSFSVVKLCKDRNTGEAYAVKIIERLTGSSAKAQNFNTRLDQEMSLWETCSHPNIIQFREMYVKSSHLWVVMDIAVGGELFEKILQHDHFCERLSAKLITSLLQGLSYLHEKGIVHRDIKPENLLIPVPEFSLDGSTDFPLKICDFGIAAQTLPGQLLTEVVGSPGYLAPEILECRKPGFPGYGTSADLWSSGVVLYILLCGAPPFHGETDDQSFKMTLDAVIPHPPFWMQISQPARDLIEQLLQRDPSKRIDATTALSQPWLRDPNSLSTSDHCSQMVEQSGKKMVREAGLLMEESQEQSN